MEPPSRDPITLNLKPHNTGLNPQSSNTTPQTAYPAPKTPHPTPQTPLPKPHSQKPKPKTPDPKPQTPNPKPHTPHPTPEILWRAGGRRERRAAIQAKEAQEASIDAPDSPDATTEIGDSTTGPPQESATDPPQDVMDAGGNGGGVQKMQPSSSLRPSLPPDSGSDSPGSDFLEGVLATPRSPVSNARSPVSDPVSNASEGSPLPPVRRRGYVVALPPKGAARGEGGEA